MLTMARIQRVMTLLELRCNGGVSGPMVRPVKDAQAEEKHCYHCGSPENFIHNCPLMRPLETRMVKWKGGDGNGEGSPDPSDNHEHHEEPPDGGS